MTALELIRLAVAMRKAQMSRYTDEHTTFREAVEKTLAVKEIERTFDIAAAEFLARTESEGLGK